MKEQHCWHGFVLLAGIFALGALLSTCLNPVGFPVDISARVAGEVDVNMKPGDENKPGTESPGDEPNKHPGAGVGALVFKNLTGGDKARNNVTFSVTGVDAKGNAIAYDIVVDAGEEKSLVLYPSGPADAPRPYKVGIAWDGGSRELEVPLLAGRVEYVYFYFSKAANDYEGSGNSSDVYVDVALNYYADNENAGENEDNDSVTRPEEGDVSRNGDPRSKLPSTMRNNYGVVWVHNFSKSMDLMKVLFDHDTGEGPLHWEMNPGPDTGGIKSVILRAGLWDIKGLWLDPADSGCADGEIDDFEVLAAGPSNYINHLYFYKGTDGKWHLTGKSENAWDPAVDTNDANPDGAGNSGTGNPGGETDPNAEGQHTNENGVINTGDAWWSAHRNGFGILVVKNLSSRVAINTVEVVHSASPARDYTMGPVSPLNEMSMILGAAAWNVTARYTQNGTAKTVSVSKTVAPLGLTGKLNYVYFYWNGHDYVLGNQDGPPADYESDAGGGGTGGNPGESEGDYPGALTDNNRGALGLLILQNLSPDVAIDRFVFTGPAAFDRSPGPGVRDQRSILLRAGGWTVTAYYTKAGASGSTTAKTTTIVAGQISYMYFYKTRAGAYSLSAIWPPQPNDALGDNTDPGEIIGEDEGWLHIINNSGTAIIDRVQYNSSGTWIDLSIPNATGTLAPGGVTDPDVVVPEGSWAFRFKTLTKTTYSRAVSGTIRAGQTAAITYTDALDSDEPPSGYGTLRIINDSSSTIYDVRYLNTAGGSWSEKARVNIVPGTNSPLILEAPAAGKWTYVVQCYISSSSSGSVYVERQVEIENQKVSTITITNGADTGTETSNPTAQIRVYNNYDDHDRRNTAGTLRPVLPARIFKIILVSASKTIVKGAANASAAPDGSLGLRAGEYLLINESIPAGNYTLTVTWGNTVFNDGLITTEIGTYYLANGIFREIYVDLYSINVAEATAVTMRFQHVGYPSAASIAQVHIAYSQQVDFRRRNPAPNGSGYAGTVDCDDTVDSKWIVYKNTDVFYAGDWVEFKIPSGKTYYARAYWPLAGTWYGQGPNDRWTTIDLTGATTTGILNFVFDRAGNQLGWFPN
jgi:hypothetical protein